MTAPAVPTDALNLKWAEAAVDELIAGGVCHFAISPGSRSSPLALAVAHRAGGQASVHVDERSGAFFALGQARATGRSAVAVSTSGTAAANYLPAVVEAALSRVPLIVITADRPPEDRDTGAWQTIDQVHLYGRYPVWAADVPPPWPEPAGLDYMRSVASRAVAAALGPPGGPVHLNLAYREPLVPSNAGPEHVTPPPLAPRHRLATGRAPSTADTAALDEVADLVRRHRRGLIVAGPADPEPGLHRMARRLARAAGYPLLADACSNLRFGASGGALVIAGGEAFLRDAAWAGAHAPEFILRLGASPVWRPVNEYLAAGGSGVVQVAVDPAGTWDDPGRRVMLRLQAGATDVIQALVRRLAKPVLEADAGWLASWHAAQSAVNRQVAGRTPRPDAPAPAWIVDSLLAALPADGLLVAANSMAIRDLDTFGVRSRRRLRVIVNRGAAGIDGTVSTAAGAAWAWSTPAALLTGDLALVHDASGLIAARDLDPGLPIVVIDDGGGGIFRYLSVAGHPAFERYFQTPAGVDLAALAAAYGAHATRATDAPGLRRALADAWSRRGATVIRVAVDPQANTAAHLAYWAAVARDLASPV